MFSLVLSYWTWEKSLYLIYLRHNVLILLRVLLKIFFPKEAWFKRGLRSSVRSSFICCLGFGVVE